MPEHIATVLGVAVGAIVIKYADWEIAPQIPRMTGDVHGWRLRAAIFRR